MSRLPRLRFLAVLFLGSIPAPGQTLADWQSVQALAPGTDVRIAAEAPKPFRAKIDNVTDRTLAVIHGAAPQSFERPQIVSVSVKKPGHRLRNTFVGLGVGAAAGLAIGAVGAIRCHDYLCALMVPAFGSIGMTTGTAVGLAWPTGGWRAVYRR